MYGNPCDMKEIIAIKKKYNLFVIEDAAESFGSKNTMDNLLELLVI